MLPCCHCEQEQEVKRLGQELQGAEQELAAAVAEQAQKQKEEREKEREQKDREEREKEREKENERAADVDRARLAQELAREQVSAEAPALVQAPTQGAQSPTPVAGGEEDEGGGSAKAKHKKRRRQGKDTTLVAQVQQGHLRVETSATGAAEHQGQDVSDEFFLFERMDITTTTSTVASKCRNQGDTHFVATLKLRRTAIALFRRWRGRRTTNRRAPH